MPNPFNDAPESIRKHLTQVGGKNPYGLPMWRACIAEHCLQKSQGLLHDLPTGDVSIFAVDQHGKVHHQPVQDSVKSGVFELPRYPVEGWILERWFSPQSWGTREEWYAHKTDDGTPMMGPYPSEGDYWMIAGPFCELPPLSDLEAAIRMYEQAQRNRPANLEGYIKQRIKDEQDARLERRRKLEQTLEQMRKSDLVPMLKGTSLSAQGFRNELQKMIGDPSHLGAVHDA